MYVCMYVYICMYVLYVLRKYDTVCMYYVNMILYVFMYACM